MKLNPLSGTRAGCKQTRSLRAVARALGTWPSRRPRPPSHCGQIWWRRRGCGRCTAQGPSSQHLRESLGCCQCWKARISFFDFTSLPICDQFHLRMWLIISHPSLS